MEDMNIRLRLWYVLVTPGRLTVGLGRSIVGLGWFIVGLGQAAIRGALVAVQPDDLVQLTRRT
jgi:hypothetical protein